MDKRQITMEFVNKTDYLFAEATCGVNKTTAFGFCPEIFDNELCWPETPPGTTANQSCPNMIGYDTSRLAYKECWENGSWFVNRDNRTWSNYTQCVNIEDLEFHILINELNVIGYSISLVALVISLWIFIAFRTLRCTRIRIHVQLFISFILNNIMWIIWYEEVIPVIEVTFENALWCQVLHVVKEYFMVANYMWMFCEALHLHLALVVVFVREEKTMRWFYAVGWGAPALIVLVHSLIRLYVTQDTILCWINEKAFASWFISVPILVTLTLSIIFLINVLRVILTIMHPNSPNPAPMGVRRAVRAALILTPLFGLQFILIPIRPESSHPLYHAYIYITVIIIPFQGLCCAVLFCFANQDVHQAVSRSFNRKLTRQNTRWSNYHYTGAVDSGGVYVVNGNSQTTNNMALLSFNRKSTQSVRL